MNLFAYQNRAASHFYAEQPVANTKQIPPAQGLISEVVFREDQPWMSQMILVPLLQQLGQQSRWQLWVTPGQKLSKGWLQSAGLPLSKIMHVNHDDQMTSVSSMIRALRTGNYSVVLGWLTADITDSERHLLQEAAEAGQAIAFIMRPVGPNRLSDRQHSGLKIQSNLYH